MQNLHTKLHENTKVGKHEIFLGFFPCFRLPC
jgi:hypothetical protein